MDRLNLENLTLVSRAICAAADFRRDSRGAHYREDFPQSSDLAASHFTSVTLSGNEPVGGDQASGIHPREAGTKPVDARRGLTREWRSREDFPRASPIRGLRRGGTANHSMETLGLFALMSHHQISSRPTLPANEKRIFVSKKIH